MDSSPVLNTVGSDSPTTLVDRRAVPSLSINATDSSIILGFSFKMITISITIRIAIRIAIQSSDNDSDKDCDSDKDEQKDKDNGN